jgi:predicted aminopeptidase
VKVWSSGLLLALACALGGCSTVSYYAQAIHGHLALMHRAEPISERLEDLDTPEALRERLARVLVIREFASRELSLPDNGSYRSYADLQRPFALWNVFAAPEFSTKPRESCFLFAGCVTYRGFYAEDDARRYADELRGEGFDAYVGGVPAYSTLGYFDDPVLNTFVRAPEPEVARLIFHELAHQVVYVRGDTMFNESFATAVEEEGLRRWLAAHGDERQRAAWAAYQQRRAQFVALIARYRDRLEALYTSAEFASLPRDEKRRRKLEVFDEMRADYQSLRREWNGFAGYDRYFSQPANNALLSVVAAYSQWVPAFTRLLEDVHGDLPAFYERVRQLAREREGERDAKLRGLAGSITKKQNEKAP